MDTSASRILDHAWAQRLEAELLGNILPFWSQKTIDHENGGFYGAVTNDLRIVNDAPRSAVLTARILWTFAAAVRLTGDETYRVTAQRACDTLLSCFLDPQYGGVYWAVDRHGRPVDERKHTYAQAFAIYGLAEYHRATGDPEALAAAQELFRLIVVHAFDALNGGYLECRTRAWEALDDMRLSAIDVNSAKSMNTTLHVMEACTNLLRIWKDRGLAAQLRSLVEIFFEHIIDSETHHFRLFFDERWRWEDLSSTISYGHDIEGSWLLVEAAEVLGDADLLERARTEAVLLANRVLREALEPDGSIRYESGGHGQEAGQKHWWAHAEAVVGFTNAYQISGEEQYARAAAGVWEYIDAHFVDRVHGDWFKVLDPAGIPVGDHFKAGPWDCPYHHSRMCFEMLARLGGRQVRGEIPGGAL